MKYKKHKNKGRTRKLILEDNDIIDQSVDFLQTDQGMCYRSLMFENQEFHVEL